MSESNLIRRQTALPEHIVQFCRFLRDKKFRCGISEERDALQVLSHYLPAGSEDFRVLMQSVFAKSKDQTLRFPGLFYDYWQQLSRAEDSKVVDKTVTADQRRPRQSAPTLQELKDWLFRGDPSDTEEVAAWSPAEAFTQKDFSAFNDRELDEVARLVRQLARLLDRQRHRRYVAARRSGTIDLRRTIRKNVSRGADIDYFLFKAPKNARLRITLFCDVSKSMDLYARFLIQFMYGFHQVSAKVETFVFSTSLTHITTALDNQDFGDALSRLGDTVEDWSGGTNIGKALGEYRRDYGRKYLSRKTVVLILSDGWDLGAPEALVKELQFIKKNSRQLIWINPLAGRPDYEPQTAGMQAALPFCDHFTSCHNVASLVELVRFMGKA